MNAVSSPYRRFTREEWANLRADTPLTLTLDDLSRLKTLHDPISPEEVIESYLPLSRLRALYFALAGLLPYFHFLKYGLGVILVFVGIKMSLAHSTWKIDTTVSLVVVATILSSRSLLRSCTAG